LRELAPSVPPQRYDGSRRSLYFLKNNAVVKELVRGSPVERWRWLGVHQGKCGVHHKN